ncbi:hypothetical protein Y032_0270g860 [Ancylostoma ceylanicum]|uniref:Uncharacterized protein n=1 Tax=Ancylostoma ceylanicum TaxID=53326 RepID=A0A016S9M1_9BILA|nr:hypothetical protein Y032_0270g860 [Ancylostoma ceylanicum]
MAFAVLRFSVAQNVAKQALTEPWRCCIAITEKTSSTKLHSHAKNQVNYKSVLETISRQIYAHNREYLSDEVIEDAVVGARSNLGINLASNNFSSMANRSPKVSINNTMPSGYQSIFCRFFPSKRIIQ